MTQLVEAPKAPAEAELNEHSRKAVRAFVRDRVVAFLNETHRRHMADTKPESMRKLLETYLNVLGFNQQQRDPNAGLATLQVNIGHVNGVPAQVQVIHQGPAPDDATARLMPSGPSLPPSGGQHPLDLASIISDALVEPEPIGAADPLPPTKPEDFALTLDDLLAANEPTPASEPEDPDVALAREVPPEALAAHDDPVPADD